MFIPRKTSIQKHLHMSASQDSHYTHDGIAIFASQPAGNGTPTVAAVQVPALWVEIYHYAWFVSFGVSLGTYLALMKAFGLAVTGERNG